MKYNIALLALFIATTAWGDADKVQKQLDSFESASGKVQATCSYAAKWLSEQNES